jgi:hypothetical protein
MKIAIRRKPKPRAGFAAEYRSSLCEYAAGGGEPALGRAYELGRRALTEQKSLVEIASLHHKLYLLWFAMRKVGSAGRNCSGRAPDSSRSACRLMRWHNADSRMR